MNIGIDIDDTIAKSLEATDFYAKEYTENILKREFTIKKLDKYTPIWFLDAYEWTLQEDQEFFKLYQYRILQNSEPKEYAKEAIEKISNNNKIIIITARENELKDITINWFVKNKIKYDQIIFEQKDKLKSVIDNKIDLFIDDNELICKSIAEIGIKTLMMDSRINRNVEIDGVERVYNWKEILKILKI